MIKTIAVIVPVRHRPKERDVRSFNRLESLRNCLNSLLGAKLHFHEFVTKHVQCNIYVIDDHSIPTISDQDVIDTSEDDIKLVRNQGAPGQGGALNYALSNIKADIYCFTDSDCAVDEKWITSIYNRMRIDKTLNGVVGANWVHRKADSHWINWITRQESLLMQHVFSQYLDPARLFSTRIDCRNLAIRQSAVNRIDFFVAGHGPSVSGQTSHKLLVANKKVAFESSMEVSHRQLQGLRSQMCAYFERGNKGIYKTIYSRQYNGLWQAFRRKYLQRHFFQPAKEGVSPVYLFLVHGAYWLGISLSQPFSETNQSHELEN